MMLSKSRILMAGAMIVMVLSACKPADTQKSEAPQNGAAAVTVNGTAISESRVEMLLKQTMAQGTPDTPELRKAIIDQLTMQYLISQEAIKKGLDKKPELMDQLAMIRQSILAKAFVQDYLKNNPVSDDMLKAEYEKVKSRMAGSEYKARHILVATEADARDIIAKLKKNPKSFESLAKAKSRDAGSRDSGGELGWFDPRSMVPEFGAAVAKLAKGKFTEEPVKSQFGYHIILLEDSRPKVIPAFEQVKPQLLQQVQQQNMGKLFEKLKADAKIEIAKAPAPSTSLPDESKPAE